MNTETILSKIAALDKSSMLDSINYLGKQCEQALKDAEAVIMPAEYGKHKNILVVGMGGSSLGADFVRRLYEDTLSCPIEISRDYKIPSWVDKDTLVVLSSYSGNTEEVLSQSRTVLKKTSKVIGITSGGKLLAWFKRNDKPVYVIDPKFNPCGQPRLGIGYGICGLLSLLQKTGDIKSIKELKGVIAFLNKKVQDIANPNKREEFFNHKGADLLKASEYLNDKIPVIVASEHLLGAAHIFNNQLNETSKSFSAYFPVPELNHHLLEGIQFPKEHIKHLVFLFWESPLYHIKNQKRYKITKEIFRNRGLDFLSLTMEGKTKIMQAFEAVHYGSYLAYLLALEHDIDPSPVKMVEEFKEKMKQDDAV